MRVGSVVRVGLSQEVSVPAGYDPITTIVGDPNGSGLWFWDFTQSQVSIFHETVSQQLSSWPVLSGDAVENAQPGMSGMGVSSSGSVWLGTGDVLVELDPSTGDVKTWAVPMPRDNPDGEQNAGPALQGIHYVQGLAVGPRGEVAIATWDSSSVEIFDPTSGTFTQLPMPTVNDEPLAVAFSDNGSLGVGFADLSTGVADSALIVSPTGSESTVSAADSSAITAYGSSAFILGTSHPYLVTSSGQASALQTPTSPLAPSSESAPVGLLPQGRIAAVTPAGVVEFPANATSSAAAAASSTTLALPQVQCGVALTGVAPPSPAPTPSGLCPPPVIQVMATDAAGDIWIVSPAAPNTIDLLATMQ
jgi:hypothetical protein